MRIEAINDDDDDETGRSRPTAVWLEEDDSSDSSDCPTVLPLRANGDRRGNDGSRAMRLVRWSDAEFAQLFHSLEESGLSSTTTRR